MSKARFRNRVFWIGLCLGALLSLAAGVSFGQDAITITQMDPSNFPKMAVYIDAAASNLAAGLTKDDFTVTEDGQTAKIVDFAGEGEPRPVDIVFVIDTTSSMGEEIDGVIRSSVAFAEQLRANNRDFRLGLVAFGDEIRAVGNTDRTLTADVDEFTGWVRNLRATGGGDTPEASLDALDQATTMQFRDGAQKVLLLITDASPHTAGDGTAYSRLVPADLTTQLRDQGFVVYAASVSDPSFLGMVNATGGKFYELTDRADFTGMIDEIGGDIAKQYRLTYISPRSSYDGTQRDIVIAVGGKTGEQAFLEPHLINIQSSLSIGIGLLALLLAALAAPTVFGGKPAWAKKPWRGDKTQSDGAAPQRSGAGKQERTAGMRETPVVVSARTPICPTCGREVRAGARFCGGCGAKLQ